MAKDVFISFCSKNKKEAELLWKELNRRGISVWFSEDNKLTDPAFPSSIPLGDDYGVAIEKGIKDCKIFILLLSKDSVKSKWVKKELCCALDYDNCAIIPINLDNLDNALLTEAFAFRLRDIQQENAYNRLPDAIQKVANRTEQILSGEVKEDTTYPKARTYSKEQQKKQKRKVRKIVSLLAVVTIAAVFFGIWAIRNQKTINEENIAKIEKQTTYSYYYSDYIWQNGVPEGLYEISEEEAAAEAHYVFEVRDNKVRSVRLADANGNTMNEITTAHRDRPAKIIMQYFDEHLNGVSFYDASGKFLLTACYDYDPDNIEIRGIRFTDQDGFPKLLPNDTTILDLNTWLLGETGNNQNYSTISQIQVASIKNGQIAEIRFGLDMPQKDENNVSGIVFEYDDIGRVKKSEFIYDTEQNKGTTLKSRKYHYDGSRLDSIEEIRMDDTTTVTAFRYEQGNCIREQYESASGSPVANKDGVARIVYEYEKGCLTRKVYFNQNGERIMGPDGWAERRQRWDDRGRNLETSYYDAYGNLVLVGKWAQQITQYDGNIRTVYWYDQDGNSAYQGKEAAFGTDTILKGLNGETIHLYAYYKKDGTPALWNGAYQAKETSDTEGRIIKQELMDGSGQLMVSEVKGYAVMKVDYYDQKKVTEYFDRAGDPVDGSFGYTRRESYYTRSMNMLLEEIDINAAGKVVRHLKKTYDEKKPGRVIREEYLDETGQLCVRKDAGYAVKEYIYESTDKGYKKRIEYKDEEGRLLLIKGSNNLLYAVEVYEYDLHDRLLSAEKHDEKDIIIFDKAHGAYSYEEEYDECGKMKQIIYLDANRNPMRKEGMGYAKVVKEYNNNNECTKELFYDEKGDLSANNVLGYAERNFDYDQKTGAYLGTSFYDADHNLVIANEYKYAKKTYEYDNNGKRISASYYDETGERLIVVPSLGYARVTCDYNNGEKWTYWGAEGQRIIHPEYGYASCAKEYDQDGNTIHITYFDENDHPMILTSRGYAETIMKYEDGECVYCEYRDADHKLMINPRKGYSIASITIGPGKKEYYIIYKNEYEQPMISLKQGYCAMKAVYDDNHRLLRETFYDTDGNPMINKSYSSKEMEYNEAGQTTIVRYLDTDGSLMLNFEVGYAWKKTVYGDKNVRKETHFYDANDHLIINLNLGYAKVVYDYNERGELIGWTYYGEDDKPIINSLYHYARLEHDFDLNGNIIAERYYGADLSPIAINGVASRKWTYEKDGKASCTEYALNGAPVINGSGKGSDLGIHSSTVQKGNVKETVYLNSGNKVIVHPEKGYAKLEKTYDESGKVVRTAYYDDQDNLIVPSSVGYAYLETLYDNNGNRLEWSYHDTDESLIINPAEGYAKIINKYDEKNRAISRECLDDQEQPVVSPALGYASVVMSFDSQGNETGWITYGADGRPMVNPQNGYASIQKEWDEHGNLLKETYWDPDGRPMFNPNTGYAGIQKEWDGNGNLLKETYWNPDGKLMINQNKGYAGILKGWDENGYQTEESYLGEDGELMIPQGKKYAKVVWKRNKEGSITAARFYDEGETLTYNDEEGCYGYLCEYDKNNQVVKRTYLGADGETANNYKEGPAIIEYEYKNEGKLCIHHYLDTEGNPMKSLFNDSYLVRYVFDDGGRNIRQDFCNLDGTLVNRDPQNEIDYSRIIFGYNEQGIYTSITYCDSTGQPYISRRYGFSTEIWELDDQGRRVWTEYRDPDGNLMINQEKGYARIEYRYKTTDEGESEALEDYYDEYGNRIEDLHLI